MVKQLIVSALGALLLTSCTIPCGTTELVRRDGFGRIYEIQVIDDCSGAILRRIYYDIEGNITETNRGPDEGSSE